jgi:hypothetical protein
MINEMVYQMLCTLVFSLATVFFVCLANREKHRINKIKKERKKWNDVLKQVSKNIEASRDVDDMKKRVGVLRTRFNKFDDQKIIASSEPPIGKFIADLDGKIHDKDDVGELKSEFCDLISDQSNKYWEEPKPKICGKVRWRMLWIAMAAFSFLVFLTSYSCLLMNYPCLWLDKDVTSKCLCILGYPLPTLSILLLYFIMIMNICFVCALLKTKKP